MMCHAAPDGRPAAPGFKLGATPSRLRRARATTSGCAAGRDRPLRGQGQQRSGTGSPLSQKACSPSSYGTTPGYHLGERTM